MNTAKDNLLFFVFSRFISGIFPRRGGISLIKKYLPFSTSFYNVISILYYNKEGTPFLRFREQPPDQGGHPYLHGASPFPGIKKKSHSFQNRFTDRNGLVTPSPWELGNVSVSKNLVIPTKRSAWRDLRSNKFVGKNHYLRAFDPEMRRSLDDPRDDRIVVFVTQSDYFDFFDSLSLPNSPWELGKVWPPDTRIWMVRVLFREQKKKSHSFRNGFSFFGDPERTRTVDLQRDRLAC